MGHFIDRCIMHKYIYNMVKVVTRMVSLLLLDIGLGKARAKVLLFCQIIDIHLQVCGQLQFAKSPWKVVMV